MFSLVLPSSLSVECSHRTVVRVLSVVGGTFCKRSKQLRWSVAAVVRHEKTRDDCQRVDNKNIFYMLSNMGSHPLYNIMLPSKYLSTYSISMAGVDWWFNFFRMKRRAK